MGLDMYLNKKVYVGANYEHNKVTGEINLLKDGKPLPVNMKRVTYIEEEVGYWRKANHIHKWFVDNVQDGVDDCGDYYVSEEKLQELLTACKNVVNKPELAASELPTQSGFFFGGTEYDDYYIEDCKNTIEIIEGLLKEKDPEKDYINGEIYYHSSW